jgi:hypothetical protein
MHSTATTATTTASRLTAAGVSTLQMAKLLPPKMKTLSKLPLLLGSLKGA